MPAPRHRRVSAYSPWGAPGPLDLSFEVPAWTEGALCAQVATEIFFPEKGEPSGPAKKVCQACPVIDECLQWAIANDEQWGIFGGKSMRERRRIKQERLVAEEVAA